MKTAIFSPCYLDGTDAMGSQRFERTIRHLLYYGRSRTNVLYEDYFILDNGSSKETLKTFKAFCAVMDYKVVSVPNLTQRSHCHYPAVWRALYYLENLIKAGYEKIIWLESDCYILSDRLTDYINNLTTGFVSLWCPKYEMPESGIMVLCKPTFNIYLNYIKSHTEQSLLGLMFERSLPFTTIEKNFVGDRYGENYLQLTSDMDYYVQSRYETDIPFLNC